MCREMHESKTCLNYRCPHNLFWEGLGLDPCRIKITNRAHEIRNCCCLIKRPWTPEEIAEAWGLKRRTIRQFEELAWRKLKKKKLRQGAGGSDPPPPMKSPLVPIVFERLGIV